MRAWGVTGVEHAAQYRAGGCALRALSFAPHPHHPPPAPRLCPRLRRGRSKARAPVARKLCLLAPAEEGLNSRPHTTAP
ncbi:hypothetical protein B4599_08600 [Xanthomonas oryzae pv. oryzae]|nr:hypothetical protein CDO19_13425 [Xanthomonas oryzae pv. oryzae]AXX66920.1 hypothetical protein B4599_08600 [Xanthomonas oryzae pv. oryzae]